MLWLDGPWNQVAWFWWPRLLRIALVLTVLNVSRFAFLDISYLHTRLARTVQDRISAYATLQDWWCLALAQGVDASNLVVFFANHSTRHWGHWEWQRESERTPRNGGSAQLSNGVQAVTVANENRPMKVFTPKPSRPWGLQGIYTHHWYVNCTDVGFTMCWLDLGC